MKGIHIFLLLPLLIFLSCNDKPEISISGNYLAVYPNPTSGVISITVQNPLNQNCTLKVIDPAGDLIFMATVIPGGASFQVMALDKPKGIFHIILDTGYTIVVQKILKV